MDLVGVRVELPDNTPVMLLREQAGERRVLPILIGTPEATAIHYAIEGIKSPRPLTHDLFASVLERLQATLERVVVVAIREYTYFAELHLVTPLGPQVVSSRPSDAIALATRTKSAIFATSSLLDQVAQSSPEAQSLMEREDSADAILDEFRDFIDSINPEDFSG